MALTQIMLFLVCLVVQVTFVYPDESTTTLDESTTTLDESTTTLVDPKTSPDDGIEVRDLPCPGAKAGTKSVLLYGMCYTSFHDQGNRRGWDGAGDFCRDNSLGDLPRIIMPGDKKLLESVLRALGGNYTWIGGRKEGDQCYVLSALSSLYLKYRCQENHSFLCAKTSEAVTSLDDDIKIRDLTCLGTKAGTKSVLLYGMCYTSFHDQGNGRSWDGAGDFCRDNFLGDLPRIIKPGDKKLLESVLRALGGNYTWIGGLKDGDQCYVLSALTSFYNIYPCKEIHSFLCAKKSFQKLSFNDRVYVFVEEKETVPEAMARCKSMGGKLAGACTSEKLINLISDVVAEEGFSDYWVGRNEGDESQTSCASMQNQPVTEYFTGSICESFKRTVCVGLTNDKGECPHANSGLVKKWQVQQGECHYLLNMPYSWNTARCICFQKFQGSMPHPENFDGLMFLVINMTKMEQWVDLVDDRAAQCHPTEFCSALGTTVQVNHLRGKECGKTKMSICEVPSKDVPVAVEYGCNVPLSVRSTRVGQYCYFHVKERNTWMAAKHYCENRLNGAVAHIKTMATAKSVIHLIDQPAWVTVPCDSSEFENPSGDACTSGQMNTRGALYMIGEDLRLPKNYDADKYLSVLCMVLYKEPTESP